MFSGRKRKLMLTKAHAIFFITEYKQFYPHETQRRRHSYSVGLTWLFAFKQENLALIKWTGNLLQGFSSAFMNGREIVEQGSGRSSHITLWKDDLRAFTRTITLRNFPAWLESGILHPDQERSLNYAVVPMGIRALETAPESVTKCAKILSGTPDSLNLAPLPTY